jgi:hypothetical protein
VAHHRPHPQTIGQPSYTPKQAPHIPIWIRNSQVCPHTKSLVSFASYFVHPTQAPILRIIGQCFPLPIALKEPTRNSQVSTQFTSVTLKALLCQHRHSFRSSSRNTCPLRWSSRNARPFRWTSRNARPFRWSSRNARSNGHRGTPTRSDGHRGMPAHSDGHRGTPAHSDDYQFTEPGSSGEPPSHIAFSSCVNVSEST